MRPASCVAAVAPSPKSHDHAYGGTPPEAFPKKPKFRDPSVPVVESDEPVHDRSGAVPVTVTSSTYAPSYTMEPSERKRKPTYCADVGTVTFAKFQPLLFPVYIA